MADTKEATHWIIGRRACGCVTFGSSMDGTLLDREAKATISAIVADGGSVTQVPVDEVRKINWGMTYKCTVCEERRKSKPRKRKARP